MVATVHSTDLDDRCPCCGLKLRAAADEIERLRERCEAYRGQVEAGAAEIERLRVALSDAEIMLEDIEVRSKAGRMMNALLCIRFALGKIQQPIQ